MVDDYRSQLNIVGWALGSVAIVVVSARVYCRHFLIQTFGLDDGLMVLAMVWSSFEAIDSELINARLPGSR